MPFGFPNLGPLEFCARYFFVGVGLWTVLRIIRYLSIFQVSANTLPSRHSQCPLRVGSKIVPESHCYQILPLRVLEGSCHVLFR